MVLFTNAAACHQMYGGEVLYYRRLGSSFSCETVNGFNESPNPYAIHIKIRNTFHEQFSIEIPKCNLYIYLLSLVRHLYCVIFAFQQLSSISEIHSKLVIATSSALVLLNSILGFPASLFFCPSFTQVQFRNVRQQGREKESWDSDIVVMLLFWCEKQKVRRKKDLLLHTLSCRLRRWCFCHVKIIMWDPAQLWKSQMTKPSISCFIC